MNGTTPRAGKKERKVTVSFRRTDEPQHNAGVESILVGDSGTLFTASRDSTIKRWDVSGSAPQCTATFERHADWVNDLALVNDLLFSCSNDTTVRVWKAQSQGTLITTLSHHSDYVTSLAAAPARGLVASGGLRGEVFILDVATGQPRRLRPRVKSDVTQRSLLRPQLGAPRRTLNADSGRLMAESPGAEENNSPVQYVAPPAPPTPAAPHSPAAPPAHKASIYSLAINQAGTLVAAGSSDHFIRLLDTRTGEKISKLRGHTENVRALAISPSNNLLLSGSSDGSLKLWDLGMQRCVQTYVLHSDTANEVLAFAADGEADWSQVISGGRDGRVFRTYLGTRSAELLVQQAPPVSAMAFDQQAGKLWVGSPHSGAVSCYNIPKEPSAAAGRGTSKASGTFPVPSVRHAVTGHFNRSSMDMLMAQTPVAPTPAAVLPGLHPIVTHTVLPDRRHILSKDSTGEVELWDVLAGSCIKTYGKADMAALEASLFQPVSVASWFSVDCKLGCLGITLEAPSCFSAEEYALILGYPDVPDDFKVNYGKMVLDATFAKWRHRVGQAHMLDAAGGVGDAGAAPPPQNPGSAPASQTREGVQAYYNDTWPKYWEGVQPAVISQTAVGVPWRRLIGSFTGAEAEPDDVPAWVGDVVLRGAMVMPKESKCAFILVPAEGSGLPDLLQSRLNAPRILQVHKVASYAISKLQESNIQLEMWPVHATRPEGVEEPQVNPTQPPVSYLELTCNGVGVPYEMSLAAVKKYIWRRSDDVVFVYRVRDPTNVAQLPKIMHS